MKNVLLVALALAGFVCQASAQKLPKMQMETQPFGASDPFGATDNFVQSTVSSPLAYYAIMDGNSHPYATVYPQNTLRQMQGLDPSARAPVCPEATSLGQEVDWCALQQMLDAAASRPAAASSTNVSGGLAIHIPGGYTLNTGTSTLISNLATITFYGDDQWSSVVNVAAHPWLAFGLDNHMGIGTAIPASSGNAFVPGDTLTFTGGTFTAPAVMTVNTVDPTSGAILTYSLSGGSYSVNPSNPLAYTTNNAGFGAVINGTFSGGALASTRFAGTGTNCAVGESLTASIGTAPSAVTPTLLTVTGLNGNSVSNTSIVTAGAFGTPTPNPVAFTGSANCSGALFNIGAFTHSGGTLGLFRMRFIATTPGASLLKAQFDTPSRSMTSKDLVFDYVGTNYWSSLADLTSLTNPLNEDWDIRNNKAFLNAGAGTAITVREQNNLNGHYEHYWHHINIYGFQTGWDYKLQDAGGFQGLYFTDRPECALGTTCLLLENFASGGGGYGNVIINDGYATQSATFASITGALDVRISNTAVGTGNDGLTTQPATTDSIYLNNVNQSYLNNIGCGTSNAAIASVNCVHYAGTSSNASVIGLHIGNLGHAANVVGVLLDQGTSGINVDPLNSIYASNVIAAIDSGTNNSTALDPTITSAGLVAFKTPSGIQAQVADGGTIVRGRLSFSSSAGGKVGVAPQTNVVLTTSGTSAAGQVNLTVASGGTAAISGLQVGFSSPLTGASTWTTGATYAAGAQVVSGGSVYTAAGAGVAGGSAPTCTSGTCSDGMITWTFVVATSALPSPAMVASGATPTNVPLAANLAAPIPAGVILYATDYANDITIAPNGNGAVQMPATARASSGVCSPNPVLTNGGSWTVPDGCGTVNFTNNSIASATITMPANPRSGGCIDFTASLSGITAITWAPNVGQAVAATTGPVTNTQGQRWCLMTGNRWQH